MGKSYHTNNTTYLDNNLGALRRRPGSSPATLRVEAKQCLEEGKPGLVLLARGGIRHMGNKKKEWEDGREAVLLR